MVQDLNSAVRLTQSVKKGGCAAKIAATTLRSILHGIKFPPTNADVIVDGRHFDDAAIYRVTPELGLVQTLDFFTPIVDTPRLFGEIASANALSDVYAMGGIPKTCLAILAFPLATLSEEVISEVLQGACDKIAQSGAALVGGHSIDDESLKFGLSVTGTVHLDRIWQNTSAKVGDVLILTKPLGTGTLCAGVKNGTYQESDIDDALQSMTTLNDVLTDTPADLLAAVHAATDITGFGLAGHAFQMAKASGVTMSVQFKDLPLFKLTRDSLNRENLTKAHRTNREYTKESMELSGLDAVDELILFDPQTSGGLLLSVAADKASALIKALKPKFPAVRAVGSVYQKADKAININS